MKKLLSLAIVLVIMVGVLVGCSGGAPAENEREIPHYVVSEAGTPFPFYLSFEDRQIYDIFEVLVWRADNIHRRIFSGYVGDNFAVGDWRMVPHWNDYISDYVEFSYGRVGPNPFGFTSLDDIANFIEGTYTTRIIAEGHSWAIEDLRGENTRMFREFDGYLYVNMGNVGYPYWFDLESFEIVSRTDEKIEIKINVHVFDDVYPTV